jgi:hypothetical protein
MLSTIIIVVIILVFIGLLGKSKVDNHSHWSQLMPSFVFSTKEFYELLKKEMDSHDIHGLKFEEVSLKIGNVFSPERLYLRVSWKDFFYDICFAPFGDGCFVSWWLFFKSSEVEELLVKIPFVGTFIKKVFFRKTYYQIDTASMFMTYAHKSVMAVIDEITKNTGVRIDEIDRKPIMNNIFIR